MQVLSSPRRWLIVAVCVAALLLVGWLFWSALTAPAASTMVLAGPVCLGFLAVVGVRAARSRVEFDAGGGVYHGLVRTRSWGWGEVRFVGRQSTYAFGSTGSTPELTLRGGRHLVLVGLADPRRPGAEDAAIGAMRAAAQAFKDAHPSVAQRLVTMLTQEPTVDGASGVGAGSPGSAAEGERQDAADRPEHDEDDRH